MAADVWQDVGTAQDGVLLQFKRNTTLGTGTVTIRTIRTVTRGRVRTLFTITVSDATWDTVLATLEP